MNYKTTNQYIHLLVGLTANYHPFFHRRGYSELYNRYELVVVIDHPTERDIDRVSNLALSASQETFAQSDSFADEYVGVILAKGWDEEISDCAEAAGNVDLVKIG